MKSILVSIVAAVLLVGCGPSVDIHRAAKAGNIEVIKQHLTAGTDVNAKDAAGSTPLDLSISKLEIADLLRKHGGKTGEELKAAGK